MVPVRVANDRPQLQTFADNQAYLARSEVDSRGLGGGHGELVASDAENQNAQDCAQTERCGARHLLPGRLDYDLSIA